MRVFARFVLIALLAAAAILLASCAFGPLLSDVKVAPAAISPNADGADDVTHINYRINRPANVSIYFVDAAGQAA